MSSKHCLLFLYMVPETGHQKAAEAIMEAAPHMDPRVECVGVDAVNQAYPFIGTVVNRMYLQMLKSAPFIWDYLYDNPEVEEATRDARGLLTFISSFRTKKMLRRFRPQAVICTQAVPVIALAAEKRRGNLRVPLVGVVTDFAVHSYWLQPEVDLYLVAHEEVKQELLRKGIKEERIRVTGIPIRPKFGETSDPLQERRRLHMNPHRPTILVMGGSHGLGPLDELVEALQTIPLPFQTYVVCGKNRRLFRKISRLMGNSEDIRALGYVKDLAQLMSSVDLLITKPGGLTCSEALAKQIPMVLTNPIPGQEERNVKFLTKHQVAKVARSTEDLVHIVTDLLRHPKKRESMRQRAKIIAKPHSAWEASRLIFDLIHKRGAFASSQD
jgi:processive 1,2-diacylglycerol beta-glucosyltransferase